MVGDISICKSKCSDGSPAGLYFLLKWLTSLSPNPASNFRNSDLLTAPFHPDFPTVTQAFYLLKSDNTIATTPENVDRILWLQFDSNNIINITENTVGLRLSFKTNNAMQMQIHQDNEDLLGDELNPSDTDLLANQIHGGTIIGLVQTKSRRSGGTFK